MEEVNDWKHRDENFRIHTHVQYLRQTYLVTVKHIFQRQRQYPESCEIRPFRQLPGVQTFHRDVVRILFGLPLFFNVPDSTLSAKKRVVSVKAN